MIELEQRTGTLRLSADESASLSLFVAFNRGWVREHSLSLEVIVTHGFKASGFKVRRIEKVEHHPVWHLVLLANAPACQRSDIGIAGVVRRVFQLAGHRLRKDCISVILRGERIEVAVCLAPCSKAKP